MVMNSNTTQSPGLGLRPNERLINPERSTPDSTATVDETLSPIARLGCAASIRMLGKVWFVGATAGVNLGTRR